MNICVPVVRICPLQPHESLTPILFHLWLVYFAIIFIYFKLRRSDTSSADPDPYLRKSPVSDLSKFEDSSPDPDPYSFNRYLKYLVF